MCGEQYRPWKVQPGYFKANKVICVLASGSSEVKPEGLELVKPGADMKNDHWLMYPIMWPDTATANLINTFKGITADIDKMMEDVPREDRMEHCMNQVGQGHVKQYMRHVDASSFGIEKISQYNKNYPNKKQWKYDHWEAGVMWADVKHVSDALDEPMSQEDFLRVIGYAAYMIMEAKSRL